VSLKYSKPVKPTTTQVKLAAKKTGSIFYSLFTNNTFCKYNSKLIA